MPHKHTRIRDNDTSRYNLPPSVKARPLPVGKQGQSVFTSDTQPKGKRKRASNKNDDDTPRAFARLMQFQSGIKTPSGLDTGSNKRRKTDSKPASTTSKLQRKNPKSQSDPDQQDDPSETPKTRPTPKQPKEKPKPDLPTILPGEKLSDFALRVNAALPVTGLARRNKGGSDIAVLKERQTKTERRLQKMYAEWRVEEVRRKDKLEEAREAEEELKEEDGEDGGLGAGVGVGDAVEKEESAGVRKKKMSKRKRRLIGEVEGKDDDPWEELKAKRGKPAGLNDVAQAPPEFKAVPREKFKVRNGAVARVADVPGSAGSLKRREELGEERKNIIERYRAMMRQGKS